MIEIEKVDHLGIRVMDADRAVAFYALLGFGAPYKVPDDRRARKTISLPGKFTLDKKGE